MPEGCNGNWRCRRLCGVGRASTRKRPPGCKLLVWGRAGRKEKSSGTQSLDLLEQVKEAISPMDARRLLPAE